jgi:carboxyl-terminal processing protease
MPAGAECPARKDFNQIVGAVSERFYDKTFRGLNWPARVEHYRKQIRCEASEQQIAARANALLAELHASHTRVYTKTDLDYWGLNSVFSQNDAEHPFWVSGIWTRRDGRKWYARYVLEGSPAVAAGILPGDELVSLNGEPFSPTGFTSGPGSLVISSDGRTRRTVPLTARWESVMQAFIIAADASTKIIPVGERRVGYIHVWGARGPILQSAQKAMRRFESERVDAVVVDFRGGYGGTSLDYLDPIRKSEYLMSVPRYLLIDESVRSGKEMVAAIAAREHLVELVGSRTAGAFLGAVPARIDGGRYFVVIAAFDGELPDLPRIERVGVAPTVPVEPCRRYCQGRDAQWEKVAQLIASARRPK